MLIITYLLPAIIMLLCLALVIHRAGSELARKAPCGGSPATMVIVTGFVTIGLGGILLAGLALYLIEDLEQGAPLLGLGVSFVCLGLGFGQAITTLEVALGVKIDGPAEAADQ